MQFPERVIEFVYHHHERWDGQGYQEELLDCPATARAGADAGGKDGFFDEEGEDDTASRRTCQIDTPRPRRKTTPSAGQAKRT